MLVHDYGYPKSAKTCSNSIIQYSVDVIYTDIQELPQYLMEWLQ